MEPLDVLSEAVINTLKEFSAGKRLLTPETLKEAFSGRREILSLLYTLLGPSTNGGSNGVCVPTVEPARVSPDKSEATKESNLEPLFELQNLFLTILHNLGPVIRDNYEKRFSEFQKKINQCESLLSLILLGDRLSTMIGELVDMSVEQIDFSNDFLIELSKNLYMMEAQLSVYHNHSRESHRINNEFHDNLLLQTNDVHLAFAPLKYMQEIHSLITSKLNGISRTIQDKRQLDEIRHQEADSKISELQNDLKTYKQEILQVKQRSESLEKEVFLDELTQINNRRAYDFQIKDSLRRYHHNGEKFSLILVDIDHFKRVNDNFGHKAGDKCLKEVAKLVKSALRKTDFLARYGGEELVAILHGCDAENAQDFAEKIRIRIEHAKFCYQEKIIPVTVSLGVTQVMPSDADPGTPFIRVDEAMYRAKMDGRNRVRVITDLSFCKISGSNFGTCRLASGAN